MGICYLCAPVEPPGLIWSSGRGRFWLCDPPRTPAPPESQSGMLCLASPPNPGPRLSLGFPMSKSMAPPHPSQTNPFPPLRLC